MDVGVRVDTDNHATDSVCHSDRRHPQPLVLPVEVGAPAGWADRTGMAPLAQAPIRSRSAPLVVPPRTLTGGATDQSQGNAPVTKTGQPRVRDPRCDILAGEAAGSSQFLEAGAFGSPRPVAHSYDPT